MKRIVLTSLALILLLALGNVQADKSEILEKISALIEAEEYDEAARMLDFFLQRNPGDPDLLRLQETWRIRKGELGPLFGDENLARPENRERLRELMIRVVRATLAGNPEEWHVLPHAVSPEILREILAPLAAGGDEQDGRVAKEILDPPATPPSPSPGEFVAWVEKGPERCLAAFRWAERTRHAKAAPLARKVYGQVDDPELKAAAAGVLLALGDDGPRRDLLESLAGGAPVPALEALRVLLRHPGKGKKPIQALFAKIDESEVPGRVKPTLVSFALEALGASKEPGAREFLEARLTSPDQRVDAARALGALGDPAALPALLDNLRNPPREEESAEGGGLSFLGRSPEMAAASAADAVRPTLVGALAVLRIIHRTGGK